MGRIVSIASKLRRDRARRLRRDQTEAEVRLWEALRAGRLEGWKWRRQVPVGPFIVDFLCLEAGVAVELDGGVHEDQADYDARRDAYLRAQGLRVLRFWNGEVSAGFDGVCQAILAACRERDPAQRGSGSDAAGEAPGSPGANGSHASAALIACAALSRPLPRRCRAWERSR